MPLFILQVIASTAFALLLVFFRHSKIDFWGVVLCVLMLSISSLFYIIVGQFFFSRTLHLVPISGYAGGFDAVKFLLMPIGLSLLARLGTEARLYRAMFLEEIGKDYVRTARAKGLPESIVLFRHVLQERADPDHHQRRLVPAVRVPRQPGVRELLRHPRARRVRDRGDRRPGLRDRALDGLRRRGALHRQLHRDRLRLHLGRPAGPPRLSPPPPMPQFVFLWTDVVLWAMLLLLVWYVWRVRISANLRATWDKVLRDPAALSAAIVLVAVRAS